MRERSYPAAIRLLLVGAVVVAAIDARAAPGRAAAGADAQSESASAAAPARVDRSGRKRVGVASVYARKFAGRKMADGTHMDPSEDNAASKTLPLGTEARVTNLETGRSATVKIQDRGPYVKGRIVDLSPKTAEKIGIAPREGVAKVAVEPIAVPPPGPDRKH
jgi:rare lipoprotein A